jgi:hypothetical protein
MSSLRIWLYRDLKAASGLPGPARVLVGLGAICFSLYSIGSILESGTSSSG